MRLSSNEILILCFRGRGFSQMRNFDRSKSACVTWEYSPRLSEVSEEEKLLIFVCLTHGNNTDLINGFSMHDHDNFHP
jgi:hypothetical protein